MKKNILLIIGVIILTFFPLMMVHKTPAPDGKEVEVFSGADSQAEKMITTINPDYKPWFSPIFEPASGEVETFLFAFQSAVGALFIGYYLGCAVTRHRMKKEASQNVN